MARGDTKFLFECWKIIHEWAQRRSEIFFQHDIYYVAIATVTFSHVEITCYFHMWGYQVFARNLTWYFIGVYIIKGVIYPSKSVFELAKSIRRTVRNRARGTDLSWERHRFWNTHSNNILHQLKTSLLKDWINERLTWAAVRASFDRFRLVAWTAAVASSCKVEDAIWGSSFSDEFT